MSASLQNAFADAMEWLGPFGPAPFLAVAVSGGADSTALAMLTRDWVARRGGGVVALIVDHGLRAASAGEAELTRRRLEACGIAAKILTLAGLPNGARLQQAARAARYRTLGQAARTAGALFLLTGHHAADQAETVLMRAARKGGGLQGMAAFNARNDVVLLRPLLAVPPAMLRDFLRVRGVGWTEDPSNADLRFERVRVRLTGAGRLPEDSVARQDSEANAAGFLACHAAIRPEGYAVIDADAAPAAALAALLRVLGGRDYAPRRDAVAALATRLKPATLGGVRIMKAPKLGRGWLLVREEAGCAPPVAAKHGVLWDRRFRLAEPAVAGATIGATGDDAAKFRHGCNLPSAVIRVLPCLRFAGKTADSRLASAVFDPPGPAAPHRFLAMAATPI